MVHAILLNRFGKYFGYILLVDSFSTSNHRKSVKDGEQIVEEIEFFVVRPSLKFFGLSASIGGVKARDCWPSLRCKLTILFLQNSVPPDLELEQI
jgi:hypothetical protein